MDIQFTEDQELLRSSVQRLLRDQYDFEARRRIVASEEGFSRRRWASFAELGLLEDAGGLGGGPLATMIAMQEFGRHLVVEPFLETVVLAGGLIESEGLARTEGSIHPGHHFREIDLGAGLGRKRLALRFRQCCGDGAPRRRRLCPEWRKGRRDRGALGRLPDRLCAHLGPSPRPRWRELVHRRSPRRQPSPAKLQNHR